MAGFSKLGDIWTRISVAPASRPAAIAGVVVAGLYATVLAILKWIPVNELLVLPVVIFAMFRLFRGCTPSARWLALHIATQLLVLSWVIHLWTLGYEGRNAVYGGILPWSDSFYFYNDSLRLIHGNLMHFAAKRPIFSVSLAALLRIFDGDLRIPLVIFALFSAWAIALASHEVWKTHGWRAAMLLCLLLLLSERQWAGFVQTEDIGLPLGLIGFVLVWRAIAVRQIAPSRARILAISGIFAVSVALMSRTGAFFVLPALAVWCARRLLPDDAGWRLRLRFFTVAIAAAFAGFCVSQAVSYLTAFGATFSDYPPIAYGLMHHKDFTYLAATHPQLASLTGSARAHEAWRIVMDEAAGRPLLLLGGLARSLAELFASPAGLFGFVFRNPDDIVLENVAALHASLATYGILGPFQLLYKTLGLYSLLNFVAMAVLAAAFAVAAVAGMVALYRRRTDAYATMLGYAVIGALASAPFMPPWITSSHQTQTATLAFLAVVPGIMFAAGPVAPQPATRSRGLLLVPAAVAALVILAAALLRAAPERAPVCGTTNDHAVRLYPSTAVTVARERSLSFGNKAAEDLRFSILYLKRHNQAFTASVTPFLKEGTLHVAAYDACDNTVKILIDDTHALDLANRGWQHVSVHPLAAPDVLHVAGRANGR